MFNVWITWIAYTDGMENKRAIMWPSQGMDYARSVTPGKSDAGLLLGRVWRGTLSTIGLLYYPIVLMYREYWNSRNPKERTIGFPNQPNQWLYKLSVFLNILPYLGCAQPCPKLFGITESQRIEKVHTMYCRNSGDGVRINVGMILQWDQMLFTLHISHYSCQCLFIIF